MGGNPKEELECRGGVTPPLRNEIRKRKFVWLIEIRADVIHGDTIGRDGDADIAAVGE